MKNGVRKEVLAHALSICDARALIVGHELLEAYQEIADEVKMVAPAAIFLEDEYVFSVLVEVKSIVINLASKWSPY